MTARDEGMLIVERPIDGVMVLRLNRPDKRNALSTPLLRTVVDALQEGDGDSDIRAFVITGGDRVFAAGADISEMASKDAPQALIDPRPALWAAIRCVRKPIIAAVEGWCLGAGNELLMCCDIAIASSEAQFGQPEANLGIIPGAGGGATLARLVGRARAMKMVLTGELLGASEALQYGLIAEVCAPKHALRHALKLAEIIAGRAPLAMQQAKAVINATFEQHHQAQLSFERQAFSLTFSTEDKKEGVSAFLEKRQPKWTGR